jgi:hypothetical protein
MFHYPQFKGPYVLWSLLLSKSLSFNRKCKRKAGVDFQVLGQISGVDSLRHFCTIVDKALLQSAVRPAD